MVTRIVLMTMLLALAVVSPPMPPNPVVVPGAPVDQEDHAVVTFANWHINENWEPRHLLEATLWVMYEGAPGVWAVRSYPMRPDGYVRVSVPLVPVWWAMYPAAEWGNRGECYSLRNAGQIMTPVTGMPIAVVYWGACDPFPR